MTTTPAPVDAPRYPARHRPGWRLGGWPLRWKMATVVAVPLMVAVGLGAIRVHESLSAADDFATIADRLTIIPLLVELDADAAVVTGTLAQRSITPELIDKLDRSIAAVDRVSPAVPADSITNVGTALADAQALSAQAKRGRATTPALIEQLASIRAALSGAVSAITEPIADPAVALETRRLEDLWAAQKLLSAEGLSVVAASAVLAGESSATLEGESAELLADLRTESALIDQLAQRYPTDDPAVTALRVRVNDRIGLQADLLRPDKTARALAGLKDSLFVSIDDYSTAVAKTSDELADAVARKSEILRAGAWRDSVIVAALLLAAILLAIVVANSLLSPLRRLRNGALDVAHTSLPAAVERLRTGTDTTIPAVNPIDVPTHEEIGQVARAIDDMHSQALRLAGQQAQLRLQMNNVFETLARRSRSLIDLQLDMIEQLEFEERDPKRLDNLFRLDHLATRMRRNGDNLLILAGTDNRRSRPGPIQLGDALRASISEVENYQRVHIGSVPPVTLTGPGGRDLVHILAELLDNALHFSPPDSAVATRCGRTRDGALVLDIIDHGIGISPDDLDELNHRIASTPEVTADTARRMGLFVVSELAARHRISVTLTPTLDRSRNAGVTATVHIPAEIFTAPQEVIVSAELEYAHDRPIQSKRDDHRANYQTKIGTTESTKYERTTHTRQGSADEGRPIPGVLPQRRPGASRIATAPAPDEPVSNNAPPSTDTSPRHLLDPTRTATFFRTRALPDASVGDPTTHPPIFASIAPVWLTDPTSINRHPEKRWTTEADAGWAAAYRATNSAAGGVGPNGLPQRVPGQRLVPGGVRGPDGSRIRGRTPDAIRANLSRHQNGVRAGRANTTPHSRHPVHHENQEER